MNKNLLCLIALAVMLCAGQSIAATPTPTAAAAPASTGTTLSPQNSRMKSCAAQYHQQKLPKSQYKSFMSTCLKNPSTASSSAPSPSIAKPITPTAAPAPAAIAPSTVTPPTGMKQ